MTKRGRDYEVASSTGKKHKTYENPKEVQPEPKSKHKRKRNYEAASSTAKKHKTYENPKEVQPEPKSKHKRARDSGNSSSIRKKKPKTHEVGNPMASFPQDISFLILDKLVEATDHVSFACVCKDWYSISRSYKNATGRWQEKGNLLPMFFISTESESEGNGSHHELEAYNISGGKRCNFLGNAIKFPVSHGNRCCGSSYGWLAILKLDLKEELCLSITLVHAFQKSVAPINDLPLLDFMNHAKNRDIGHFKENYQEYITKVVLSCDPILNPDSYVVAVIYDQGYCDNSKLAFFKKQHQKWTYVDRRLRCLNDTIFYRNQLYVVGGAKDRIISFDVNGCKKPSKPPKANVLTPNDVFKVDGADSYLVESAEGDHLWHVRRRVCHHKNKSSETIKVYKVVFNEEDGSVVEEEEVHNIGDETLFVGTSHSMSVLASNFPGCKPNSVYYATDFEYPDNKNYRIFSLDNETITKYEQTGERRSKRQRLEIPYGIWVLPMFKGLVC